MPMVSVQVELPYGWELAEPVMRSPNNGEWFINSSGRVQQATHNWTNGTLYPIIRRSWQWPEWLTAEWIAMDRQGRWYAFEKEPILISGGWVTSYRVAALNDGLFNFTPPPCTDWRESKRRNQRSAGK